MDAVNQHFGMLVAEKVMKLRHGDVGIDVLEEIVRLFDHAGFRPIIENRRLSVAAAAGLINASDDVEFEDLQYALWQLAQRPLTKGERLVQIRQQAALRQAKPELPTRERDKTAYHRHGGGGLPPATGVDVPREVLRSPAIGKPGAGATARLVAAQMDKVEATERTEADRRARLRAARGRDASKSGRMIGGVYVSPVDPSLLDPTPCPQCGGYDLVRLQLPDGRYRRCRACKHYWREA